MIIGMFANFAGYECAMSCIKGVAVKRGVKIIDKVLIPAGAFIIASMVGDKCQEYTEARVEEVKSVVDDIRNARKEPEFDDSDAEEIVNNVFGKVTEYDENGKPIAGVYPMKNDKEVTEDGDSENAE